MHLRVIFSPMKIHDSIGIRSTCGSVVTRVILQSFTTIAAALRRTNEPVATLCGEIIDLLETRVPRYGPRERCCTVQQAMRRHVYVITTDSCRRKAVPQITSSSERSLACHGQEIPTTKLLYRCSPAEDYHKNFINPSYCFPRAV